MTTLSMASFPGYFGTLDMDHRQYRLEKRGRGRLPAIPQRLFETVFTAYRQGSGYRAISNRLAALGVAADKSSVARLIRGQGCYKGRRVPSGNTDPNSFNLTKLT